MKAISSCGMKTSIRTMIFSVLLMQSACVGTDEMRWKEEVRLHAGAIILIDRYSVAAKSGFPNSRRGNVLSLEIKYAPLGFSWATPDASQEPLSFEIIDGEAYLATVPVQNHDAFCRNKKKGTYQAHFYRWRNRRLEPLGQHEVPLDRMSRNITGISQWGSSKEYDPTYLSASQVNYINMIPSDGPPTPLRDFFEKKKHSLVCP